MKNHFPEGYCPQREKVVDLSRSILGGNREFMICRRQRARYMHKLQRQMSREQLARAAAWLCTCGGDAELDCGRCYGDDMPTKSETHAGKGLPKRTGSWSRFEGSADTTNQLFRWCQAHVAGMDNMEVEEFLRAKFLTHPAGHTLQTRHAFDHLFEDIIWYREKQFKRVPWLGIGVKPDDDPDGNDDRTGPA